MYEFIYTQQMYQLHNECMFQCLSAWSIVLMQMEVFYGWFHS